MDEADRTFKWVCEKCGACLEETDLGMLEVRRQTHKCIEGKVTKPVKVVGGKGNGIHTEIRG